MKRPVICLWFLSVSFFIQAQEKWDLRKCVDYAIANNISVKQADLQSRFSKLALTQGRLSQYPNLDFQTNTGFRFGRSDNPTTGILENKNFLSASFNLSSSVTLFNWFSKKAAIASSRLSYEADVAQIKKVQDDISLNVAVGYLQALLAKEQVNIAVVQVQQTAAQLESVRKQVTAGKLPELNAAEIEAQLARDSSSLVTAQSLVTQNLLQLKALLNLDAATAFDITAPPVEIIPVESLSDLQPEAVYNLAINNLPQQKVNNLRLQSSQQTVKASRGNMYPALSAYGGLGSNYVNIKIPQYTVGPKGPSGATVNVGGTDYFVEIPTRIQTGTTPIPLERQFRNNFGESIGLSINVPLFSGGVLRTNWERSKLNVQQWYLQIEQDNQKLKQDIYRAYTDAVAAIQKFNANRKTVAAADKAYNFAQKRFELGLVSTYDLLNSQNNVLRAKIEMLYARFDYVFKLKLLEFYKGQGLKL